MVSDAHAHLDMPEFKADREEVIARARQAGLKWIINVCMLTAGAEAALDFCRDYPFIRPVVGCHPHDAVKLSGGELERLERLAGQAEVVGLGEIGLDFFRLHSPKRDQEKALEAQLDLAARLGLPIVIHDRDAHQRTVEIIRSHPGLEGMFHCFSGDKALARQVLDLGFYISIPGVVTFPKAASLKRVAAFAPLERLLVETDCPYLAPQPWRGKRNEPAYVVETAKAVAEIRGIGYDELAARTTANLERLFSLNDKGHGTDPDPL